MFIDNEVDLTLWESLPEIPTSDDFRGYACTSIRDTIYLSGGLTGSSSNAKRTLLSFDMMERTWTDLPPMNFFRWGHRMVALEGGRYLFAIGGWGYRFGSGSNIHDAKKDVPKKKKSVLPFRMNRATSPESNENSAMLEKLTSYEIYDVSKQIWKEAGQLNESRRDFAITVDQCSGKIYAFGGTGINGASSSVEVFNPHTNSWSNLKPMPEAKRWCHAIQVGNLIHIFETGKKTLTYNIDTDTWSTDAPDETFIPKCPHKGKVCAVASFSGGGNVVVYGYPVKEMDGKLADRWMVTNVVNHRSKSWMVLPQADEFMYYRMVVANGKLVILTGNSMIAFQVVDDSEDDLSTLASSSHSTSNSGSKIRASSALTSGSEREVEPIKDDGTWKLQPELKSKPPDFRGYACCSVGENVYISGGCSGDGTIYRSFLSYNVITKKWKKLQCMTHRRLGHRMAVTGNGRYLYVLGGGDGKTLRSMGVDVYDFEKQTWTAAPAMNTYRVFFGFTVCADKIYVFGGVGNNNGNTLSSVEVFDPKTNGWEFASSLPVPRGVCNVITIGHVIFVFGLPSQKLLTYDTISNQWLNDVPSHVSLPACPPGGCCCAASSFDGGECIVLKYPLEGELKSYRRTAHIYNSEKKSWSTVHLLDSFACYSAIVAGNKLTIMTPQNQLQSCAIPQSSN